MGFLDSLLGGEGKAEGAQEKANTNPFYISLSFSTLRLSANAKNSTTLLVKIKNISNSTLLVSADALLPRDCMLGFDATSINKAMEKRIGEIRAGESAEAAFEIFANNQTKIGNYPIEVTVFSHYIGFEKVLAYMKKKTSIRVV